MQHLLYVCCCREKQTAHLILLIFAWESNRIEVLFCTPSKGALNITKVPWAKKVLFLTLRATRSGVSGSTAAAGAVRGAAVLTVAPVAISRF